MINYNIDKNNIQETDPCFLLPHLRSAFSITQFSRSNVEILEIFQGYDPMKQWSHVSRSNIRYPEFQGGFNGI